MKSYGCLLEGEADPALRRLGASSPAFSSLTGPRFTQDAAWTKVCGATIPARHQESAVENTEDARRGIVPVKILVIPPFYESHSVDFETSLCKPLRTPFL